MLSVVATAPGASVPLGDTLRSLAPGGAAALVRALGRTLRLRAEGVDELAPLWRACQPIIYAMWHGRILMAPWLCERLRATSGARAVTGLASRSRDGELVARFAEQFGLRSVRGSSSRGGAIAVRALAAVLRAGEDVVVVPDGPRGPARRVQPGVALLASITGAPVVALAVAARPSVTIASWDRFVVPVPFARAAAVFGPPLPVSAEDDRERARQHIEAALEDVTKRADDLVR